MAETRTECKVVLAKNPDGLGSFIRGGFANPQIAQSVANQEAKRRGKKCLVLCRTVTCTEWAPLPEEKQP